MFQKNEYHSTEMKCFSLFFIFIFKFFYKAILVQKNPND